MTLLPTVGRFQLLRISPLAIWLGASCLVLGIRRYASCCYWRLPMMQQVSLFWRFSILRGNWHRFGYCCHLVSQRSPISYSTGCRAPWTAAMNYGVNQHGCAKHCRSGHMRLLARSVGMVSCVLACTLLWACFRLCPRFRMRIARSGSLTRQKNICTTC